MKDALIGQKYLMTPDDMTLILTEMQQEQREKVALATRSSPTRIGKTEKRSWPRIKRKKGLSLCPAACNTKF